MKESSRNDFLFSTTLKLMRFKSQGSFGRVENFDEFVIGSLKGRV
jgi:hypothetical protein